MSQKNKNASKSLVEALHQLIESSEADSQESICKALQELGYEVNQSKVSRLLKKIGAVKIVNAKGFTAYALPREPAPPSIDNPIRNLIVDVVANETLVIIFTSPGSASMVARMLDFLQAKSAVLGTIAGDDTIFVAPKSVKDIALLLKEIRELLL